MAILTDVSINIGETPISDYLNISLSQQTLMHHHLHITIRKDLFDKDKVHFHQHQQLIRQHHMVLTLAFSLKKDLPHQSLRLNQKLFV